MALWVFNNLSSHPLRPFQGPGEGAHVGGGRSPDECMLDLGCPLSPDLLRIFLDRTSKRGVADVVLLASSNQDLHHVIRWFAAECEAI